MTWTAPMRVAVLATLLLTAACGDGARTPEQAAQAVEERIAAADLDAADEQLRAAILRWPDDSRLRELQGDLDLERGHGTRAQAAYERAARGAPRNRALQVKLARALLVQNRLREVLLIARSEANDSDDVRAGFDLVRLEAELAGGTADFRASREAAESLWRVASQSTSAGMVAVTRRLEAIAPQQPAIAAGREHARCLPPDAAPAAAVAATGKVLRVGAGEALATPAAAAAVAVDGAVIEIAPGDYDEAVVTWTREGVVLRGAGGRPRVRSLWIVRGARTVIENVDFAGEAGAAAGIRAEDGQIDVRDASFSGAGAGLVAPDAPRTEISISHAGFAGGARIDVGAVARLSVEFSHIAGEGAGAPLRSRALATVVRYSRIVDAAGNAGPLVDLVEAGKADIVGSELLRGRGTGSPDFVAFVPRTGGDAVLSMIGNTFFSEATGRNAVRLREGSRAIVANNVFAGLAATLPREAIQGGNVVVNGGLVDPLQGDFRLQAGSPAIDAAVDAAGLQAPVPVLEFEYRHPAAADVRRTVWTVDAGAHEYCGSALADLRLPGA